MERSVPSGPAAPRRYARYVGLGLVLALIAAGIIAWASEATAQNVFEPITSCRIADTRNVLGALLVSGRAENSWVTGQGSFA